jgi:NADPH-dependent glutamate synthase beta subunit-like oxidoreductase/NAD-dependent dihydropyrimidine dehydrogenase PreA subunit
MRSNVSVAVKDGPTIAVERRSVAKINPRNCVNCGTCRDICPTGAVSEYQRIVCRLCPNCGDHPAMSFEKNAEASVEKACTTGCPLGIMPQGYVNLTRRGKYEEAYQVIWRKNPLPSVCARICHHPCEQSCKRGTFIDEPVAIRAIKRFLTDNVDFVPKPYPVKHQEEIAVIGSGPAGLTAAHYLSFEGYRVTVFESEGTPGGMMVNGIPSFRLPREVTAAEIERLEEAGITIRCSETIGKRQMDALKEDFDAILVATGAPNSKELRIDGWRKEGIYTALQFMKCAENNEEIARHPGQFFDAEDANVVVIGGGNVALDCARTALRLGAASVTCTCLESGDDVPCHPWEREEAEDEGVRILEGWAPQRFEGVHNGLSGVAYQKVVDFKKENGRISFGTDEDKTMELDADYVIVAIGQAPDSLWADYYDDQQVFFAGDVKDAANSVVDAMAAGKAAALRIIESLSGCEQADPLERRHLNLAPVEEKVYPATRLRIERPAAPIASPEERTGTFDEVEGTYSADDITLETMRCLECGYEVVDPLKCIGCGACQRECPAGDAITMVPVEA